ncbi:26S proteasome subunit RPN7-domain-containing protein [Sporodiniella umbellata]|nr:26S proteasome subunit RPN7-domain-containing protein [Sporodiniella umbellata]
MNTRVEVPESFDFESYINNYGGFSRISRALFIAKKCDTLSIEAYRFAIKEIKQTTFNVKKYKSSMMALNVELEKKGKAPEPLDQDWINNTTSASKAALDLLENELKTAKSKLYREDMRKCYIRLGEHYHKCGDSPSAIKNLTRSRDYCTNSQQTIEMCFNTIKVYADNNNFTHVVQTCIARADAIPNTPHSPATATRLKCYQALTSLAIPDTNKKFQSMAKILIDIPFEFALTCNDILSPNDIAIYGGLSALSSFDRQEISTNLLNNSNFKNFLGLEPLVYELVESFYRSKYSRCFEILSEYKQLLQIDIFIQPNLDHLVQLVQEKAIKQYCIAYSNIDMRKMALAFNVDLNTLEEHLVDVIGKNEDITARIDSHNKVNIVRTKAQDKRSQAFASSFAAGDDFEKSSKALLLRLNLLKANLIIK